MRTSENLRAVAETAGPDPVTEPEQTDGYFRTQSPEDEAVYLPHSAAGTAWEETLGAETARVLGDWLDGKTAWAITDTSFWVGNRTDLYVGSIERIDADYLARDMFGRERGTFTTLARAERCLEAFIAHPSVHVDVRSLTE
ncbi:hypothetical protein [Humibacter antri]